MDLFQALSHPCWEVSRLLGMAKGWLQMDATGSLGSDRVSGRHLQSKQSAPLAERLGEEDVATLIANFRAGITKSHLAEQHGCSVSTIARLLRSRGVRRWRRT